MNNYIQQQSGFPCNAAEETAHKRIRNRQPSRLTD